MNRFILFSFTVGFCMSCISAVLCLSASGAEFEADLVQGTPRGKITGKIFVKGQTYRMDLVQDDIELVVIVDPKAGVTRVLALEILSYMKLDCIDPRNLMNDPFQCVKHQFKGTIPDSQGEEELNGYLCEKVHITFDG